MADACASGTLATHLVTARVRLSKTPSRYLATRSARRELPYEAMLASGRTQWERGEQVRVYRARGGAGGAAAHHRGWRAERRPPRL